MARRSFVSTVLLSAWDALTVRELRSEAKARGLSTQGNKSTLVARITQHEHKTVQGDFPAVRLPDISRPSPSASVQVPYLPDLPNAAQPTAISPLELERPKVHVVGGSATHYDGGPTHSLEKPLEDNSPGTTVRAQDPPASKEEGLSADFWESLGLSRSFSTRRTLSELARQSRKDDFQARSRPLTDEERRGLYVLLGIVGGSWLVGGLVNRRTDVAEAQD